VAERLLDESLEPYLGLHYPASDVPAQARALYVQRRSRMIVSSTYDPALLVPPLNPLTSEPNDLSQSELRSVSPHHLTYMRNMGVGGSLSVSLVTDGELVGMISCNNGTPRHVPYLLRRACELLGQQVALQLDALGRTAALEARLRRQQVRADLVEQAVVTRDLSGGLAAGPVTVLDLVRARGAVV
ncbi:GAF domain-containing protein, partial [Cellulomonas bogoriensis]|uniref:GAF domain-containing protein n=1 Tax=Cellulomonas bogoriensis TaxID=301388 RepID=UPI0018DB3D17